MKVFFAFLGTALFAAAILLGGTLATFINPPSMLIVIGGMVCFSLAHHDAGAIRDAIGNALGNEASPNVQKDISVLATLRKTTYGSGVAGTLIGLIQMLQSLDDPSSIGPAMAVALLTTLYGAFIANVLFLPMRTVLENYTSAEIVYRGMVITGLQNIARGESPRNIQDELVANLAPAAQAKLEAA